MKKFLLLLLLSFSFSFGENIGIKEAVVRNLPEEYKRVFTQFLTKNIQNSEYFDSKKEYSLIIQPFLSWIGISYTICFDIYEGKRIAYMGCVTANSGEELYESIKSFENNYSFLKIKNLPERQFKINLLTKHNIKNIKKVKITSQKGDNLVDYKKVIISKELIEKGEIFKNVIVHLNTVVLSNKQAGMLFQKLLNNFKVKDILLIERY